MYPKEMTVNLANCLGFKERIQKYQEQVIAHCLLGCIYDKQTDQYIPIIYTERGEPSSSHSSMESSDPDPSEPTELPERFEYDPVSRLYIRASCLQYNNDQDKDDSTVSAQSTPRVPIMVYTASEADADTTD